MNINLEYYKIFYYVAKSGNITRAANELMISQPAISKTIKGLESQLNCKLFVRNKFGVILTEEGKYFYKQIKQAMELIDSAEDKLNEMVNLEVGTLNIGASNTLTQKYLMRYIKEFHKMYPKIKIKIHTDPSYILIKKVRNGLVDFIVLNLPYEVPNDFLEIKLIDIHDGFFAGKGFLELKNKKVKLSDLNNYPLILLANGSNTRYFIDKFCSENGVTLVPEIDLASYSLVTEFTKANLGIGLLTKEFVSKELENGDLFEVKTEEVIPNRNIGYIHLKNQSLNYCSKEFIKLLKKDS